jgi:hypothetical protein
MNKKIHSKLTGRLLATRILYHRKRRAQEDYAEGVFKREGNDLYDY